MTIKTSKQYESAVELYYFLDTLGLKYAWKARAAIMRREGEYWECCDHCGDILGNHEDEQPCLDKHGEPRRKYNEDWDIER